MKCYLQLLGTDSGDTGQGILLFLDSQCLLFNVGEVRVGIFSCAQICEFSEVFGGGAMVSVFGVCDFIHGIDHLLSFYFIQFDAIDVSF